MSAEMLDLLDCAGRKTGDLIERDEAHRTGAWHGAFHCLIIYERGGSVYALFQKRSMQKKIAAGKYDISAGGHYSAGEDAETAGPREIREELGIDVKFSELIALGRRVSVYCFTDNVKEYEFQDVFLYANSISPEKMHFQDGEVDAVFEMHIGSGIELFSGKVQTAKGRLFRNNKTPAIIGVSAGDFVPCLDNYYLKLLLLANRYLNGDREHLVI